MKKYFILLLIALQLISVTICANAIQLTEMQANDLYNLGIMTGDEEGNLRLNDNITRAEFTKMICFAGDIAIPMEILDNSFDDVTQEHWAYKYIYAAKEQGIVNGYEDGNFNPESNITNEEIVKMIVCLLGYDAMAKRQSGYPAGYTSTAAMLGITNGLNLKTNTFAIRNDVAVMVSNALDIPIMVRKDEDDKKGDITYVILDGKKGLPYVTIRGTRGEYFDTSLKNINRLAQAFASQYPYKEGDTEKSFELYPDIIYSSGIEKTEDGMEYECPAIYDDNQAYEAVSQIRITPTKCIINGLTYETQYATFKSELLVPYDMFKQSGCKVMFDKERYVATITDNDNTLEIIPNIIGMRKNQAEGYWVPLSICARFVGDTLYVPLEAVAKEFDYDVIFDGDTNTITLVCQ